MTLLGGYKHDFLIILRRQDHMYGGYPSDLGPSYFKALVTSLKIPHDPPIRPKGLRSYGG